MRARIEVECKEPAIIIKSLKPEIDDALKFDANIKTEDNKLILTIESKDISGLLAGINSYMRLIRVAKDTTEDLNG
jgi:tRNA threonylcarbamoyladenosine modification (KEOPS) complex  Pcc1 subunit